MNFFLAAFTTPALGVSFGFVLNLVFAELTYNFILILLTISVDPRNEAVLMHILETARTFAGFNEGSLVIGFEADSALFEIRKHFGDGEVVLEVGGLRVALGLVYFNHRLYNIVIIQNLSLNVER